MLCETIRLIEPMLGLRDDFCALAEEFQSEGDPRYEGMVSDFPAYIQQCSDEALGRNLTPDRVPTREVGLKRLLVTADSSNVASWRVIEKNGGVLRSEAVSQHTGELLRKYWVAL